MRIKLQLYVQQEAQIQRRKEQQIGEAESWNPTTTTRELIVTRLILAATEALKPGSRLYVGIVDAIREDHIRAAKCFIEDTAVLSALAEEIEVECGRLASILGAAQVTTSKNRVYEGDCDGC